MLGQDGQGKRPWGVERGQVVQAAFLIDPTTKSNRHAVTGRSLLNPEMSVKTSDFVPVAIGFDLVARVEERRVVDGNRWLLTDLALQSRSSAARPSRMGESDR